MKMEYKQEFEQKPAALDCLNDFHDVLSAESGDSDEETLYALLQNLKKILAVFSIDFRHVKEWLERCQCPDKTTCYKLAVSCLCGTLLDKVAYQRQTQMDGAAVLSMQQQHRLSTLLQFISSHGISQNLNFQISILIPKNEMKCPTMKALIALSRCLLTFCGDDGLRDLVLPRHQVVVMASLLQILQAPASKPILTDQERQFSELSLKKLITTWLKLEDAAKCLLQLQGSACRPAPPWLRRSCGRLLSNCLVRPNGLFSVVSALLASFGDQVSSWKKAEVASHILTTPPHRKEKEEYFRNICRQSCSLLQPRSNRVRDDPEKIFLQILTFTMLNLYTSSPEVARCYFFNKLLSPFSALYSGCEAEPAVEGSFGLTSSVETLHAAFVVFKHPARAEAFKALLVPRLSAIFATFTFVRQHVSHLQSLLREILVESFQLFGEGDAARMLLHMCGVPVDKSCEIINSIKHVKEDIGFQYDELQELTAMSVLPSSLDCVISKQDGTVRAFMDLLSHYKRLSAPVLICLVQQLGDSDENGDEASHLFSGEEEEINRFCRHKGHLLAFAILTALCEEVDTIELLVDGGNIYNFIEAVMRKASVPPPGEAHKRVNSDSLKTCFAMLGLFLMKQPGEEELSMMRNLIIPLQEISVLPHLDEVERESAAAIAFSIATHDPSSPLPAQEFKDSSLEGGCGATSTSGSYGLLNERGTFIQELSKQMIQADDERRQSDDEPHRSDDEPCRSDDEPRQSDDEPHRSDDEPRRSDDEPRQSDDEPHRSDDEPCRSDDEPRQSDDESHRSDDEPHRSDDEPCRSDDEPCRSDDEPCRSDDEPHRSDDEPRRSDDEPRRSDEKPRDEEQGRNNRVRSGDSASPQTHDDAVEAMESVHDPDPPIRAAAFRFIASSLSSGKMEASEELCNILTGVLVEEEDAFVYLSAIQALVECIDRASAQHSMIGEAFQKLVLKYDALIQNATSEAAVVKIGEVVMRMAGKLGDLTEIRTRFLVSVLFRACRDRRSSIRSSGFSILAQLCPLLCHSLIAFQHELSDCLCSTARSDSDAIVRRAAIHAIRALTELGPEMLQVFPDTMANFYTALKRAYTRDVDNVVQLHAQLAIEALDVIMRDVIFNEPERRSKDPRKRIVFS